MEEKKEAVFCDVTTGVCGSADESDGIMAFVDLSASVEQEEKEADEEEEA